MSFKVHDQVVIKSKQLFGNISTLESGTVAKVSGDKLLVAVQGEQKPREVDASTVQKASTVFGDHSNVDNSRQKPVVKLY